MIATQVGKMGAVSVVIARSPVGATKQSDTNCHPRGGEDPESLDSRFRGNDRNCCLVRQTAHRDPSKKRRWGGPRRAFWRAMTVLFLLAFPLTVLATDTTAIDDETCFSCHDTINPEKFQASIHGSNQCTSCHSDVKEVPHTQKPASVNCGACHEEETKAYSRSTHGSQMGTLSCTNCHGDPHVILKTTTILSPLHWSKVPTTCGTCHNDILEAYQKGVHGKALAAGKRDAPVCTDCHGEHSIKSKLDPTSRTYPTAVSTQICARCHASERLATRYQMPSDRVKTYLESYHGLATRLGVITVANCASCHGAHDILPSSDPNSSVNKKNLPKTCGKCHPGVSEQLAKGAIHDVTTSPENRIVFYVSRFYIILIVFLISGMVLHNALDFLGKLRKHYEAKRAEGKYVRFTLQERIQHLVLTVIFIILAYTGFALEYPEAWWAFPFKLFEGGGDWRGVIHRAAAIVFVALAVHHLMFMLVTRRGRKITRELLLHKKDFSDVAATLKYNLGKSKDKPRHGRFGYAEKFEYWALMWGSVIMIVTGTMLTFENVIMKYLPKWALDVATKVHFYEAVLATLAIAVWHFYFVIFDPDHYPMNWSMVTGKVSEEEKAFEDQQDKNQ